MTFSGIEFVSSTGAASSANDRTPVGLCRSVAVTVAAAFGVPLAELQAATRRPRTVAFARQSAMYLAHVVFGLSFTEIGRAFGRDRTTAAYACASIEELRDDPTIDALFGALELACAALAPRCVSGSGRELRS